MRFRFEDVRDYGSTTVYEFTNESLIQLRKMFSKAPIRWAAGISSGGDVPLTVMLPIAQEKVVAIDHSYKSLRVAALKALAVEHHSGEELHRLIQAHMNDRNNRFDSALVGMMTELIKELPEPLQKTRLKTIYDAEWRTQYVPELDSTSIFNLQTWGQVWKLTPMELDAIRERLENLTFVHGDLRDLKNYQPIDALYLSNAFEHSPHDRAKLDLSTFTSLVPPDGNMDGTVSGSAQWNF